MNPDVCQRFQKRRELYRPAGEPIDTRKHGVELFPDEGRPRDFIQTHHYAGSESYPSTQCRVGLYRTNGASRELVGVMVFGVPQSSGCFKRWTPSIGEDQGTVLQRLVLLHDVPANGETWFLGRAFEALRSEVPGVKVVLSYSDPCPRVNAQGVEYKPGHIGRIYQAHNGVHLGETRRDDTYLLPDGGVVAPRSMSKLRNSERGGRGLERRLLAAGAPPRLPGESDRDYAYRLVRGDLFLRRRRRPGNFVYAWPVAENRFERRALLAQWAPKPYPKQASDFVLGPAHLEVAA
jgi:hypothetical protein